jgi:hypothetical protein
MYLRDGTNGIGANVVGSADSMGNLIVQPSGSLGVSVASTSTNVWLTNVALSVAVSAHASLSYAVAHNLSVINYGALRLSRVAALGLSLTNGQSGTAELADVYLERAAVVNLGALSLSDSTATLAASLRALGANATAVPPQDMLRLSALNLGSFTLTGAPAGAGAGALEVGVACGALLQVSDPAQKLWSAFVMVI